ncbi:hypothetical protein EV361DRAFT_925105 [Lentinula raphanica]|nr:hypothetical protein EV361DRAFT_925105 [Lentinula raphanica]
MRFSVVLLLGFITATHGLPKPGDFMLDVQPYPAKAPVPARVPKSSEAPAPAVDRDSTLVANAQTPNTGHHNEGSDGAESTEVIKYVHVPKYLRPSARFESLLGETTRKESQTWTHDLIGRIFHSMGLGAPTNENKDIKFQGVIDDWQFELTSSVVLLKEGNRWRVVSPNEAETFDHTVVKIPGLKCMVNVVADHEREVFKVTFRRWNSGERRWIVYYSMSGPGISWNAQDKEMVKKFRDAKTRMFNVVPSLPRQ